MTRPTVAMGGRRVCDPSPHRSHRHGPWLEHHTSVVRALHRVDAYNVLNSEYLARFSEPAGEFTGHFGVPNGIPKGKAIFAILPSCKDQKRRPPLTTLNSATLMVSPFASCTPPGHTRGHSCIIIEREGRVHRRPHPGGNVTWLRIGACRAIRPSF